MTAMAHESLTRADDVLLEGFLALDTPEGFRAELVEGEIVVTPPPDGEHEDYIAVIVEQVHAQSATPMRFSANKGLILKAALGSPKDHVIPDGTFVLRQPRSFLGAGSWMPCEAVIMVLGVTSTRPKADREVKRVCYARAEIPLYLLVDRDTSTVTLFSEPDPKVGDYLLRRTVPFGEPLPLPDPFGFTLDLSELC